MAWNTAQMQKVLDHWAQRRGGTVPPELVGRVAPSRTEGINLRGVFRFRALRRENPSVCGCRENDGRSIVKCAKDAEVLRFCQDQNASDNQLLARAPLGIPGKHGFPLPYVIARKTRGPRDAPLYDSALPLNRDQETGLYAHHGRVGYWTEESSHPILGRLGSL